jgi:hypothetical protein
LFCACAVLSCGGARLGLAANPQKYLLNLFRSYFYSAPLSLHKNNGARLGLTANPQKYLLNFVSQLFLFRSFVAT